MRRVLLFGRHIDIGIPKGLMSSLKMRWSGDDHAWPTKSPPRRGLLGNKHDRSRVRI